MAVFIAIEGIDGAGLSTQASNLRDWLTKKGKAVLLTKEPTTSLIGGIIRAGLRRELKFSPLVLQLLYAADRANHLDTEIEPALKKGRIVICDRYILSSLAYGSMDGVPLTLLKTLNAQFRRPDLTLLLDVYPKIALERIRRARYHIELFETEQKLAAVRQAYLSLKNYFAGTHVIDANKPIEQVWSDIKQIIERKI